MTATAPTQTRPPAAGKPIALYDGHCRFCTEQAEKLARMARGAIEIRSFQEPGALDAFPGITHEACMVELKLVGGDGRVYGGAEAVVRALRLGRPLIGRIALGYYFPGVRWLADRAYAWVAKNRYRLFGKTRRAAACDGEACAVHFDR
jgi:predicted DCC family thiol-disulfide oxidoreductase YuxK